MKKFSFLAIFSLIISEMVFAATNDVYYDIEVDGIRYVVNQYGAKIVSVPQNTLVGVVTIPDSISYQGGKHKVYKIEQGCFYCNLVTEITIPFGLDSVGENPFVYCSNIEIINWKAENCKVDINQYGWIYPIFGMSNQSCNVKELNICEGVKNLPRGLCYGLTSLKELITPNSLETIPQYLVCDTNSTIEKLVVGRNVKCIKSGAFYRVTTIKEVEWNAIRCSSDVGYINLGQNIEKFTYADDVEYLQGLFGCSKVKSITLPSAPTKIGFGAFNGCGIEHFIIPSTMLVPKFRQLNNNFNIYVA